MFIKTIQIQWRVHKNSFHLNHSLLSRLSGGEAEDTFLICSSFLVVFLDIVYIYFFRCLKTCFVWFRCSLLAVSFCFMVIPFLIPFFLTLSFFLYKFFIFYFFFCCSLLTIIINYNLIITYVIASDSADIFSKLLRNKCN